MRAWVGFGLAVLAAAIGYGVSRMQVESPRARSTDATQAPAPGAAPSAADDARAPGASESTAASFVHEAANTATYSGPATATPLPPETMPLSLSVTALTDAMRGGSREATLRLLRQTRDCRRYADAERQLNFAVGAQEDAQRPGSRRRAIMLSGDQDEKPFERMARSSAAEVAQLEDRCEGFSDADDALRFEAQWRAALMGELEGLLEFSLDPAIDRFSAFQQFDRIERYRARAPGFLQQALAQHSAQAVANLMHAHDPEWMPLQFRKAPDTPAHVRAMVGRFNLPPLRQISRVDAATAYAYARLCERVCPDPHRADAEAIGNRLRGQLDSRAREAADAQAERMRQAHFPDAARAEWLLSIRDDTAMPPRP